MQKETKKQKAAKTLEERLKQIGKKTSSPLDSNPLIAQAKAHLKPNFGLEEKDFFSNEEVFSTHDSAEAEPAQVVRTIQGAVSKDNQQFQKVAADTLAANTLAANALAANTLAANTLAANTLAADTLAADTLAGDTLAGDTLAGDTLAADTLAGDTLAGDTLAADTLAGEVPIDDILVVDPPIFDAVVVRHQTLSNSPGESQGRMKKMSSSPRPKSKPTEVQIVDASKVEREGHLDFSKDDVFVFNYLSKKLGARAGYTVRLFSELYKIARSMGSPMVWLKRAELMSLMGTNANSTVTNAIEKGVQEGLFSVEVIFHKNREKLPGTYFEINFPWLEEK